MPRVSRSVAVRNCHAAALQGRSHHDDIAHMWGSERGDAQDWADRFDERTHLPRGPLEHLPVPLEGEIVGARSCSPSDGSPGSWKVEARCAEGVEETVRFYEEYLPLAGYTLRAIGVTGGTRGRFGRRGALSAALVVFWRDEHVGAVSLRLDEPSRQTIVSAEMAHRNHPLAGSFVDPGALLADGSIRWRRFD